MLFWGKSDPKNEDCQFKRKFGTQNNSNMQNSIALFIFSILDRKYLFWANLVQKVKIVSLKSDSHFPKKFVLFAWLKAL